MRFVLRHKSTLCAIIAMLVAASGCTTSRQSRPEGDSKLFLERSDYDRQIERAVGAVLDDHRFTIPWVVIQGSESSPWFVSERFHSLTNFERVFVHITKAEEVHVKIQHREIALSDWHFGDGHHFLTESEEIKKKIEERLSEESWNARR